MLLCIAMYQLSHLLEFQAGHICHDLRVSQSDDVDLLVQENRSHDPAMLKGVNPVRHKAPWPELCFLIEKSILRLSRPEMSIRNSDVPLHQIGDCLRRNKIPSKVGGRSPWRGEKPKEENKRHVCKPVSNRRMHCYIWWGNFFGCLYVAYWWPCVQKNVFPTSHLHIHRTNWKMFRWVNLFSYFAVLSGYKSTHYYSVLRAKKLPTYIYIIRRFTMAPEKNHYLGEAHVGAGIIPF